MGEHGRCSHASRELGERDSRFYGGLETDAEQLADVGKPSGGFAETGEVSYYERSRRKAEVNSAHASNRCFPL